MTRRNRWFGLGLSLALVGMLLPAGSVLAQTEATGEVATETTPAAPPSGYTWEELVMPKQASSRSAGFRRFVAVDAIPGELSLLRAWTDDPLAGFVGDEAVWSSSDGATWKAAKGRFEAVPFANPRAWLVPGGDRLIMAADANLMTSPDGGRWKDFEWPEKQGSRYGQSFRGVVQTAEGLLAVAEADGHPVALTSADGARWSEEQVAPDGQVSPGALAYGADGTTVLAGSDPDGVPLLWLRSAEGEWSSVLAPWDPTNAQFTQLGYAAGRFFVQASVFEQVDDQLRLTHSVWISPDGATWEPGPMTGQQQIKRHGMAVGPIEGGVLVVTPDAAGGPPTARWSGDWETWTEAVIPELPGGPVDPWLGRLQDGRVVLFTRGGKGTVSAWAGTALP
jgi:hypothetical protein